MIAETVFWILLGAIFYNYLGYPLLLMLLYILKRIVFTSKKIGTTYLPDVTIIIAAYNEKDYVTTKVKNTNELDYPKEKLTVIWVTDGSDDGTEKMLGSYSNIMVLHESRRNGKIGAINRAMGHVTTPIVVFCDANTLLNKDCISEIVKPFEDERTGCVAGEKKVLYNRDRKAVAAGEGMYWDYESLIKRFESDINSTVGAAGELFAIRTHLFNEIPGDSVVEDFVISLEIVLKGYKNRYAHKAVSVESASFNIHEELKRKIRIAYGSIQTLFRYPQALNLFRAGFFSFQYFSHKVLRWTVVPWSLPILFMLNLYIVFQGTNQTLYLFLLGLQISLYVLALAGYLLQEKRVKFPFFFAPFYFFIMNYSIIRGYIRYLFYKQDIQWEKAKRAS